MKTSTKTLINRLKKIKVKNGAGQEAYFFPTDFQHYLATGDATNLSRKTIDKWDNDKKEWVFLGVISRDLILSLCHEEGIFRDGEVLPKRLMKYYPARVDGLEEGKS